MLQKPLRNLLLCGGLIFNLILVGCGAKVGGFKTFGPKVGLSSTAIDSAKYSKMSEAEKDTLVDEAIMSKLGKIPDSAAMSGNFAIKKVAIISAPFTMYYDHNSPGLLGLGLGKGSKVVKIEEHIDKTVTTYRSEYLDNLNAEQRTAIADNVVEIYANALKRQGFEVIPFEKVINSNAYKNKGTKPKLPSMSPTVNVTDGVGLREKPASPSYPTGFRELMGMMGMYDLQKDKEWGNAIAKELGIDGWILLNHTIEWNLYGTGASASITLMTNLGRWEDAYKANGGDPYDLYIQHNYMVMLLDVGRTSGGHMLTVGEGKDIHYRVADSIVNNIEPIADQLARAMRKHYPQPEAGKALK